MARFPLLAARFQPSSSLAADVGLPSGDARLPEAPHHGS
jgi:hypothetical protein